MRSLSGKTKTDSLANTRFDPIRSWSKVRRDLFNSTTLNKEDWDVTLSGGIEVRMNVIELMISCCLLLSMNRDANLHLRVVSFAFYVVMTC